MNALIKRHDVINLAKEYSNRNFDKFFENQLKLIKESEYSINKLKEKYAYDKIDEKYFYVSYKSLFNNKDLIIPARGINCKHSDCVNFETLFQYSATLKQ
jgi:hypothetical protein